MVIAVHATQLSLPLSPDQEPALQAAQTTSDNAVASAVLARTLPSTSLPHIVTAVQTPVLFHVPSAHPTEDGLGADALSETDEEGAGPPLIELPLGANALSETEEEGAGTLPLGVLFDPFAGLGEALVLGEGVASPLQSVGFLLHNHPHSDPLAVSHASTTPSNVGTHPPSLVLYVVPDLQQSEPLHMDAGDGDCCAFTRGWTTAINNTKIIIYLIGKPETTQRSLVPL